MTRRFPDFLKAYAEFADDGFCPPQFAEWAGLSILAGALERRVWLPWNHKYSFYPNIYVLLISKPGQGKSVSISPATDLLRDVNRKTGVLNIMPSQVTEAKFIELMGHGRSFTDRSSGKEMTVFQNAGYYFASEASNSLRNIFGDFIACLTDFYDCPAHWERGTKKDGKKISLQNVCMNLLAGSTFDYLGKLVSDENIQGGFASRLIYVVQKEEMIRVQKWQSGQTQSISAEYDEYRKALLDDLILISQMTGPMRATPEFGAAWEAWYPQHQVELQKIESEKMRSILARTNTNVIKVSMLLSAAASDDRLMKLEHFEQARALIEGVNAKVPDIFLDAKAAQGPRAGGDSLASAVISIIKHKPSTDVQVRSLCVRNGHQSRAVDDMIVALLASRIIERGAAIAGEGIMLKFKG